MSENGQESEAPEQSSVLPGLVPTQWNAVQATLTGDGPDLLCVMLEVRTPTGVHITFWPEDTALTLGQRLLELGQATAQGAVLGAEG